MDHYCAVEAVRNGFSTERFGRLRSISHGSNRGKSRFFHGREIVQNAGQPTVDRLDITVCPLYGAYSDDVHPPLRVNNVI